MKQESFIPRQEIERAFDRARRIIEPLAMNPGDFRPVTVTFDAPTEQEAHTIGRLVAIAGNFGINPKISALLNIDDWGCYDAASKKASVRINPQLSSSRSWPAVIESAESRLGLLEKELIRENEPLEQAYRARQEQEAKENAAQQARLDQHRQQLASAAEARAVEKARQPQYINPDPLLPEITTVKQAQRANAELLASAVRTLASQLDTRDDATLETAQMDGAARARVAMQRELAETLLSSLTIRKAGNALGVDKFPALGKAEAADAKKSAQTFREYLKEHPEAQEFLKQHTADNPALPLLVQAALIDHSHDLCKAAAEFTALFEMEPNIENHKGDNNEFVSDAMQALLARYATPGPKK